MKLKSPLGRKKLDKFLSRYIGANENTIDTMSSELIDNSTTISAPSSLWKKKKKKGNKKVGKCLNVGIVNVLSTGLRKVQNLGNKEKLFVARTFLKKVYKQNESKFRNMLTSKLMSIEAKKSHWILESSEKNAEIGGKR